MQLAGGSFRHFLCQVSRELEGNSLGLLLMSTKHRGKYLLRPGPITYAEEKLLQFFGQVCKCFGILSISRVVLGDNIASVDRNNHMTWTNELNFFNDVILM